MANDNHKARSKKRDPQTTLRMTLRSSPDRQKTGSPCMPWMDVVDAHLKLFGFKPGERVFLSINHVTRQISISPDFG
ncbi:protein of unknown function [Burkholderia multivorans]